MKVVIFLCAFLALSSAFPQRNRAASSCDPRECKLPNCRCSSTDIPGNLTAKDTPQFVLLTFDDAVGVINIDYYRKALYGRKNANGCPISATFFFAHEYTDYSLVHELHANGNEIALHSITHQTLTNYWKNASVETLTREFADLRDLAAKFAKIPAEDIKGLRMPFLQMAGNNQFKMMLDNDIEFDLSWPTRNFVTPGLWPYTTDYLSSQECLIGPCPTESFPGRWVIPMINWEDSNGTVCSMIDACVDIPTEAKGIFEWMKREFHKQYYGNRAPLGFYTHAAWFNGNEERFEAYLLFLDYLTGLPDVFLSSASQVIDWMKKPLTINEMLNPANVTCQEIYKPACTAKTCQLIKEGKETRYMTSCASNCPNSYPWLGNPFGELSV